MYKKFAKLLAPLCCLFAAMPLLADVVWPGLFLGVSILGISYYTSLSLIIVSVLIESIFFGIFINQIKWHKALLMSIIGNIASTIVGTIVMALAVIGWHVIGDRLFGGTFNIYNWIATFILMCLGSCLIELVALRLIFKYSVKQLYLPVLAGNITTYFLAYFVLIANQSKFN